ncbi:MAG: DUF4350 domain-containing protein [Frankiales bacterium]|nr:DUF4350 domain-containing protein [Frankiales bacterium]
MTLLEQPTATGPTVATAARSLRGPVVVAAVLVLTGLLVAALTATGGGGRLDPDSYTPAGTRAVAELLRDRGTRVVRVDTVQTALAARADLLVIPQPAALSTGELEQLARAGNRLVVVGADDVQLRALGVRAEVRDQVAVDQRRPACDLPAAVRAGDVDLGGLTYRGTGGGPVTGCYATGGNASLLVLDRATLLGDGSLLTNDRLDDRGNAALALGLLGAQPDGTQIGAVAWLVPLPGRAVAGDGRTPLSELIADGVTIGAVQLLVVLAVLALWRARRLGRVVSEPLPVVVRAAEAVEGRGRLYRAAGARGQAAEALRAATRDRLARRVGAGAAPDRMGLVTVLSERTGEDKTRLDGLLYGADPGDDAALVRLSDDLRTIEKTLNQPETKQPETKQEVAGS